MIQTNKTQRKKSTAHFVCFPARLLKMRQPKVLMEAKMLDASVYTAIFLFVLM